MPNTTLFAALDYATRLAAALTARIGTALTTGTPIPIIYTPASGTAQLDLPALTAETGLPLPDSLADTAAIHLELYDFDCSDDDDTVAQARCVLLLDLPAPDGAAPVVGPLATPDGTGYRLRVPVVDRESGQAAVGTLAHWMVVANLVVLLDGLSGAPGIPLTDRINDDWSTGRARNAYWNPDGDGYLAPVPDQPGVYQVAHLIRGVRYKDLARPRLHVRITER